MKPEAMRVAIAEACGWKHVTWNGGDSIPFGDNPNGNRSPRACDHLPDYLSDLNACHEMIGTLEADGKAKFVDELLAVATKHPMHCFSDFNALNATAPQRCEAFLKTVGKSQPGSLMEGGK
jgi:hypothetical protein